VRGNQVFDITEVEHLFEGDNRSIPDKADSSKIEQLRRAGRWGIAAVTLLSQKQYDDFDALCLAEDEPEFAAVAYGQINLPARAAKIYDLMDESGKSGKADTNDAKQKPQDTAQPESDSVEHAKGEDVDQLVCPHCGVEVQPHWTVCPNCDADLQQRKCKNCGEPLESDWKRCPACRAVL
jgi:hypothetical protein